MGVDADLTLHLSCRDGLRPLLEKILASGWAGEADGWPCIPLSGDTGDELERVDSLEEVFTLFYTKRAANRVFGIRLWWKGGEHGAHFLLYFPQGPDGSHDRQSLHVSMLPFLNRVKLDGRATDVSWYLPKLLPLFREDSLLEGWAWEETP